jgi:hypothetical protein
MPRVRQQEGIDQVVDEEDVAHLPPSPNSVIGSPPARAAGSARPSPGPRCRTGAGRRCSSCGTPRCAGRSCARSRARTGRPCPWSSRRGCGSPAAASRRCRARDVRIDRAVALALEQFQRHVVQAAVDLVGRGHHQRGRHRLRARRLQHVERAQRVDGEVLARIVQAGGHRHLRGEVEDVVRPPPRAPPRRRRARRPPSRRGRAGASAAATRGCAPRRVARGCRTPARAGPSDSSRCARLAPTKPAPPVMSVTRPPPLTHAPRPAEYCVAAVHMASPRAVSSALACATRSTAAWPSSQAASSARPSSSVTRGV